VAVKNWRVVRVLPEGTLYVLDTAFWTKNGAQAAATDMNNTFGAMVKVANSLNGHNYWVTRADRIPKIQEAMEIAKRDIPVK
jgi:hypothetical protein